MAQPVTQTGPQNPPTQKPAAQAPDGPPGMPSQMPELPQTAKSLAEVNPAIPGEVREEARKLRIAVASGNHEIVYVPEQPQQQPQSPIVSNDPRTMGAPTAGKIPTPEELVIIEMKGAVEKYFRKHGLNFPGDFDPTSGKYDVALKTMLDKIYTTEGVVDGNGSQRDGSRIDFRSLGVLFPEEHGMERAQRALASLNIKRVERNAPTRAHLAQLNDPEMLAPTADAERQMRLSLIEMHMPELAGKISVDGRLPTATSKNAKNPELQAVAELQRELSLGAKPDKLVGTATLNSLEKLGHERFTRMQTEQTNARNSVVARTTTDVEVIKSLLAREQLNNNRHDNQIQQLQASDSQQSALAERKRLLDNLTLVVPNNKIDNEKFLRRLVDGLSAYVEQPTAEYSKETLRKNIRSSNDARNLSEKDYDAFLKENGMISGKASRVIFLQTKAAILLEQIREKEQGPMSLTAERGLEASDMNRRTQSNAPANPNGTIVINISQPESGNPAFEAKMRQVVKDVTERKFLGLFSY